MFFCRLSDVVVLKAKPAGSRKGTRGFLQATCPSGAVPSAQQIFRLKWLFCKQLSYVSLLQLVPACCIFFSKGRIYGNSFFTFNLFLWGQPQSHKTQSDLRNFSWYKKKLLIWDPDIEIKLGLQLEAASLPSPIQHT